MDPLWLGDICSAGCSAYFARCQWKIASILIKVAWRRDVCRVSRMHPRPWRIGQVLKVPSLCANACVVRTSCKTVGAGLGKSAPKSWSWKMPGGSPGKWWTQTAQAKLCGRAVWCWDVFAVWRECWIIWFSPAKHFPGVNGLKLSEKSTRWVLTTGR